jgi:hypothetical protein
METLIRNANRGSVSTGSYEIENSCLFDSASSHNMYFYPDSTSSTAERKKGTISFWVKRSKLGTVQRIFHFGETYDSTQSRLWLRFLAANTMNFYPILTWTTTKTFEDPSAWYHIVVHYDTTQDEQDPDGSSDTNHAIDPDENPEGGSGTSQTKCWVNGIQMKDATGLLHGDTNGRTKDTPSGWGYSTSDRQTIGYDYLDTTGYFDGYLAEFHAVQGQVLEATDFGEFDEDTGIWKPIEVDLDNSDYGENGFYLKFDDSADMGADSSGEGNDFTLVNIDSTNQCTDTPTNNFATCNILIPGYANASFTEGATVVTTTWNGYWHNAFSTITFTSGKWYFEAQPGTSSTHITTIGYADEKAFSGDNWPEEYQDHVGRSGTESSAYVGSDTELTYGRIWPAGTSPDTRVHYDSSNIIGVAIDADNGYVYWSKDGTFINSGDPTSGSSGTGGYAVPTGTATNGILIPAVSVYYHTSLGKIFVNFGGYTAISIASAASDANGYGTFEYAPPSGYYALCTKNLAEYG